MAQSKQQSGFSIVEMMVAIVIGLFLLGGAISMLVTTKRTYTTQDDLARLQENARFALDFISRDLRMVGHFGCSHRMDEVNNNVVVATPGDLLDSTFPLEGFEQASVTFQPSGSTAIGTASTIGDLAAGTDAITIRYLAPNNSELTADMVNESDDINIDAANGLEVLDFAAVSDCGGADLFKITGGAPAGAPIVLEHAAGANTTANLQRIYRQDQADRDSEVLQYVAHRYYVANDANGDPALFRDSLDTAAAAPRSTEAIQLIDGVENVQFEYGVDFNQDKVPDRYIDANESLTVDGLTVDLTDATDWIAVASVRVSLLLRSVDENSTDTDARQYTVGSQVVGPFNDRRRRRVFTTTVFLRNMVNLVPSDG